MKSPLEEQILKEKFKAWTEENNARWEKKQVSEDELLDLTFDFFYDYVSSTIRKETLEEVGMKVRNRITAYAQTDKMGRAVTWAEEEMKCKDKVRQLVAERVLTLLDVLAILSSIERDVEDTTT